MSSKSDTIQSLIACYCKPKQPLRTKIESLIHGTSDLKRAWNVIINSELLPRELTHNLGRKFRTVTSVLEPHLDASGIDQPDSIQAILQFAANPNAILDAEHQAKAFADALSPWRAVCDNQIVWNFISRASFTPPYLCAAYDFARDTIDHSLDDYGIELISLEPSREECPLPIVVRSCIAAWEGWQLATSRDYEIGGPKWPLDLSRWKFFKELANPFDALIKLWLTGYEIYSVFDDKNSSINLFCRLDG